MKKSIYGLIDSKTGNFGDVCILDRDEEFRDGCVSLLTNPDIPDYVVEDLVGVRYGSIVYDSDMLYPKFDIATIPSIIVSGHDLISLRHNVKEVASDETADQNT
ncbi:hypothetical protein [Microviridae sp.]|nr:hypothetical protein [Microviridae sp.]